MGPRTGAPLHTHPSPAVSTPCPVSPPRLEQPAERQRGSFQALSPVLRAAAASAWCRAGPGALQPEAVLAFMARCLRVVVCHLFTGESLQHLPQPAAGPPPQVSARAL